MTQNNMEVVEQAASACRASDLTDEEWMDAFGSAYVTLTSAQAEIERLTKERDEWRDHVLKQNENVAHNLARAEAAEKERDALRETLRMADEIARVIIANPAGSLWNYGTNPSRLDEAKWHGSREAAEDILAALQPLEPKND